MDTHVNYDPREDAYSKPLDQLDVSDPQLYYTDTWYPYGCGARIQCITRRRARMGPIGR